MGKLIHPQTRECSEGYKALRKNPAPVPGRAAANVGVLEVATNDAVVAGSNQAQIVVHVRMPTLWLDRGGVVPVAGSHYLPD